jgi:hypothetical protein
MADPDARSVASTIEHSDRTLVRMTQGNGRMAQDLTPAAPRRHLGPDP